MLAGNFDGDHGSWSVAIWASEELRLVVYSLLPARASAAARPDVEALLSRINHGLLLGNFELNDEDGSVRYKTSIGVVGVTISDALVRELVYPNVATVDRYLAAVTAVSSGGATLDDGLSMAAAAAG